MLAKIRHYLSNISDRAIILALAGIAVFVIGFSLGAYFQSGGIDLWGWLEGISQNLGTEMIGAFLTFYLIEVLRGRRKDREAKEEEEKALKVRLIQEMGSNVKDAATQAAYELRTHGWGIGEDVSLVETALRGANLQEADLGWANLKKAALWGANLQDANLYGAKLQEADLSEANLQGANLGSARLRGANLGWANLQGADLRGTNLQGADLHEAKLQGALHMTCEQLQQAETLQGAILPDGTELHGVWRDELEKWCETVKTDWRGTIQVGKDTEEKVTKPKTSKRKTSKRKAEKPS